METGQGAAQHSVTEHRSPAACAFLAAELLEADAELGKSAPPCWQAPAAGPGSCPTTQKVQQTAASLQVSPGQMKNTRFKPLALVLVRCAADGLKQPQGLGQSLGYSQCYSCPEHYQASNLASSPLKLTEASSLEASSLLLPCSP